MFAAHISHDKKREQSVWQHCTNTSEICADICDLFGAYNIGKLVGLLHDMGKLCHEFDSYVRGNSKFRRGEIDHSYAGAKFITEISDKEFKMTARLIARVIISHHGLHDWVDENCRNYFNIRISNDKNYRQIRENIKNTISEEEIQDLLKKANEEHRMIFSSIKKISENKKECAFYTGMFERLIESALIDADRTDTASFMDGTEFFECKPAKELWQDMKSNMNRRLEEFAERKDVISLQRKNISDRCSEFAKNNVRICRLIVPTGGGKTLSSLRFAIEYCQRHEMERIFYTAPFMSILEQNSDEIKNIAGGSNFIEHHSNALAEIADNSEELSSYELHTERWDKPVIATTMVQFLNALFSGKMSAVRRFHRLAKSVIIIDEVQSVPLKCVYMFNLAVNFLSYICGAAVVLCTATQPISESIKHKLILDKAESMTGDYSRDFEIFRRTDIVPVIDPYGYTYEEAANFCTDKFEQSGNLLVIVNTKSSAVKLYQLIRERCSDRADVVHLSTNMCPQHRRDKLFRIKSMLEKNKPVICVTTQLIEAGVDISFRCVVRSLAGLDSAVQAAGRCNRNGTDNKISPVYLIKLQEEKLGNLREISVAQDITYQMIDSGKYEDLSSPETISQYFRMLYQKEENILSYIAEKETLLNYLSLNRNRFDMLKDSEKSMWFESQAFRTAGNFFRVIDNNTRDVIVPYNAEAEEIIEKLENSSENIQLLLRKAQKFMVSIYSTSEYKLNENNALYDCMNGALILEKSHYNDETGIDAEGAEKELLIF